MNTDQDALRRKNEELNHNLREKNKKLLQTQELYDKMKRRGMLGQVQTAASNAVDDTIQMTATGSRFNDSLSTDNHRPQQPQLYANQQTSGMHHAGGFQNSMQPPLQRRRRSSEWTAISSQGNGQVSQHRKKKFRCSLTLVHYTYEDDRRSGSVDSFISSTALDICKFSSSKHRHE